METFTAKTALSFAWKRFTERPWMLVGIAAALFAVSLVSSMLFADSRGMGGVVSVLFRVADFAVHTLLSMGMVAVALKAHDALPSLSIHDAWHPQHFLWYALGTIMIGVATMVGFVLLIVPGVILSLMLMFAPYLMVEKRMKPLDAMKESKRLSDGHKWELFFLLLALVVINILGAIPLGLGLLVSVPVSLLAVAHVYRILSTSEPAPAPAAPASV